VVRSECGTARGLVVYSPTQALANERKGSRQKKRRYQKTTDFVIPN